MQVRYFALIFGIVYLLVGVMGFIPGLVEDVPDNDDHDLAVDAGHGELLGIFPVNTIHNLVHALVGLAGIAAYRSYASSRAYARAVAVLFGVLTIMGLIPGLDTMFGLTPLYGNDVWLHAANTLLGVYFGWVAPAERERIRTERVVR